MKKRFSWLIIFLLVCSFFSFSFPFVYADIWFIEDCNTLDLFDGGLNPENVYLDDSPVFEEPYSFKFDTGTTWLDYTDDFGSFPAMNPNIFNFVFYLNVFDADDTNTNAYLNIKSVADDWIFSVGWKSSGAGFILILKDSHDGVTDTGLTVFSIQSWYKIKVEYTPTDMDVYVNGSIEFENVVRNQNYAPSKMRLYIALNENDYNLDYIGLGTYGEYDGFETDESISLSANLEDVDDDGADWVFTEWKYYDFTVTVEGYVENASLRFSLITAFETVTVGVLGGNDTQIYSSDLTYLSREGEPVLLGEVFYDYDSGKNETTVIFPLWFRRTVLDLWDAGAGVDVYAATNGSSWSPLELDFFRIYTKGGFTLNQAVSDSDAYVVPGSPFSFHCENGSSVYNEIWYRDVQHIKLMPTTHFIAGREEWELHYGCDYSLGNGEWITGWWININPDFVSYAGVFAANIWINMTVTFNDGQEVARVYDSVYMYYHGSVDSAGDRGWYNMFIDLWVSDKNASSVTAGRVNAYEYPMIDNSDAWLRWLASNWGVKDDVLKELGCDHALFDGDGNIINSEQISMVRYWSNLTVGDANTGQSVEVHNFDVFDVTHSQQLPLVGISTPVFDETTLPTVGQKGLLGALFSMFSGVGQWLSENVIFGGLNLWDNFVNFLDTIAGMLGAPKFFTNLFAWLAEMIGYLAVAIGYLTEILTALFSLMTSMLGAFLEITIELIAAMVNTITLFTDMMGGAYGTGVDIWDTLEVSQWITLAIIFYPLYLIILWDEKGMDAVISQLTLIFGILSWVFNFLLEVARFVLRIITSIIESIPVAE